MNELPEREVAVFNAARRLTAKERAVYLDKACGSDAALRRRVEELLQVGETSADFLEQPALAEPAAPANAGGTTRLSVTLSEKPGDQIGRYKLLQQIGEGGCGVVYMAEQHQPVRRRVALKVIKLGMDTKSVIARFEAERQALAMMDHPNIAKVFDGGATEAGRPYFVMELVRGLKITDYCDEKKLSTRERLDLFMQVCQAIQHAHQKGIIHRDIKPSNVLVTVNDGVPVPKVIDFGIAKATSGQQLTDKTVFTAFEQFIGTPAYMSPEQAVMTSLDIDTRSDIYALGVLLYELLTGRTPFDTEELLAIGLDEMRRTIREKEPSRPSTRLSTMPDNELSTAAQRRGLDAPKLVSELRGDLDWIVMKALEKYRARRYETANGLALDIQRHLRNEPVLACPPSTLYRLQKLARRNQLAFVAASAVGISLVAGLAVSTVLYVSAKQERDEAVKQKQRADEQAAVAQAVNEFLQDDLLKQAGSTQQANTGFQPQPDLTVKEALRRASQRVGQRFATQPAVEFQIQDTLGEAFLAVGDWKMAIAHLERALAIRKAMAGPDDAALLDNMRHLAAAYSQSGQLTNAIELSKEALKLTKATLGADHPDTLRSMGNLAGVYGEAGRLSEEVALCQETLKLIKAKLGPKHPDTLAAMNALALAYFRAGQSAESLRLQEEAVELAKSILGPDHPNTLIGMKNLAGAYQLAGRSGEAITLLEETLKLQKAKLGADHPTTLRTMNSLAMAYREAGRLNEAVPLQEETLNLVKAKLGPDQPDTLINMNNVAEAYRAAGRVTEAVSLDEETFKLIKAKLGPDHPETLRSMNNLGLAYRDAGRFDEALALLDETVKLAKSKLGPDHPFTTTSMDNLLTTCLAAGRATEAQRMLNEVLAPALARQPQDSGLLRLRALFFARSARWKEAEADFSRLIELKPDGEEDWHRLAAVLVQEGEAQPYRDHCRKSVERFAETTNPPTAFHIAKDCLVLPDSTANLERVAKIADNALIVGTNNSRWPAMASTKALAEFRQGRFADAADWAERTLSPRLLVLSGGARSYVEVETYAVLAMARHQLHQNEAAQAALGSGDKIAQDKLPKLETGDLGENWPDWVFSHALLREAKAVIAGGPETK